MWPVIVELVKQIYQQNEWLYQENLLEIKVDRTLSPFPLLPFYHSAALNTTACIYSAMSPIVFVIYFLLGTRHAHCMTESTEYSMGKMSNSQRDGSCSDVGEKPLYRGKAMLIAMGPNQLSFVLMSWRKKLKSWWKVCGAEIQLSHKFFQWC